ncbi:hypothetical protein CRUP_019505, partial [Coryphaenoides rupestris]
MSRVSRAVLGVSVLLTLSTVAAVHLQQRLDQERLRQGVIRDLERLERKKENLRVLDQQRGLEEGEVEGETLLMVESEDQGSVDLSHEQSGDSLTSDMGEEGEAGWACEDMAFYCDRCHKWIPSGQLRGEQPSYLKGDNFFKFICCGCSDDGKETFERMRLTWQQVVMLAMYNLSLEGTGRQGYFRWKEDICAFIGRHWSFLLAT